MIKLIIIVVFVTLSISCSCSTISNNINNNNDKHLIKEKWGNDDGMNDFFRIDTFVGRTFGGIRRLKLAIPAIMYKLGVVTTMLGFLTLFTIKGVIIGLIILVIQLGAGLSKLHGGHSEKKEHGWGAEPEIWPNKSPQNIHVHVHGTGGHHQTGHYSYSHSPHPPSSHSPSIWDRDRTDTNSNLNLYASLTPYSAYNNYNKNNLNLGNSRLDDDLLIKLREYKELKELRELRDSLYQQVV